MFENYEDEQVETAGMKQLRESRDKAVAALKAKEAELDKLAAQVKTQSVREILRDLKVNPKVANLIPSDLEPTADAVSKWYEGYKDVFGAAQTIEANPESGVDKGNEETPTASRPNVDDATANALNRLQSAEAAAGVVPPDREQQQLAALAAIGANSKSAQEVLGFLSGKTSLPS